MVNRCYHCGEEEYFDHILLYYTRRERFGTSCPFFFGVAWVLPFTVKELLLSWYGSFVGKKR